MGVSAVVGLPRRRKRRLAAPLALLVVVGFGLGGIRTGDSASTDSACRSDPSSGVSNPSRLSIQSSCAVVTGTIISRNDSRSQESDGDWTFIVQVDSSLQGTYGSRLQAEIVPQDSITPPALGTHVRVVGPWVIDSQSVSGFPEIHPVWSANDAACGSSCSTALPPGPPTGLSVTPYNGGASLSWQAPAKPGGAPVNGYVITYSPPRASDGHIESVRDSSTNTTVDGFANGTSYTFSVSALNAGGRGPASSPVSAIPFTLPGAPIGVTAKAGSATAQVSWSPPASNGGSPITGYTITSAPGGAQATVAGTATQGSVTGLQNGASYTFSVKATNAAGPGPASASSNAVVPVPPPPPPPTPQSTPTTTPAPGRSTPPPPGGPPPTTGPGQGYWLASSVGGVFAFGDAKMLGSTASIPLNKPVVGIAATPSGNGYWMVATDGGIFNFGDARFMGSTGGIRLNQPIVGMASTPSGSGYYLVASDGGIFTYGDAHFLGSTGSIRLNKPIVGMALTPSGNGYWLVASDGGIFSYGDATFLGSTGSIRLNRAIVGMAATPTGNGYWMVASDGGIFNYGDALFRGSASAVAPTPVVGMIATPSGAGYWMATIDGQTYAFGDATARGTANSGAPVVGIGRLR